MIKSREENYKEIIYDDLVYFLMTVLLSGISNKKEKTTVILKEWEKRNRKMVNESLAHQAKKFSEITNKEDKKIIGEDEAAIMLSPQGYIIELIRSDLVNKLEQDIHRFFEEANK